MTFILRACRTPLGALGGSLKAFAAPELAARAMAGLLAGLDPEGVEACILGMAVQAGAGPNPAREAARLGGLPSTIPAFTLNQGTLSGLEAVVQAARGEGLAVAGGMESASRAPYLLPSARWGTRMGASPVLDALLQDARWPEKASEGFTADGTPQEGSRREIAGGGEDDPPLPVPGPRPGDGAALVLLGTAAQARTLGSLARIAAVGRGRTVAEAAGRALAGAGLALGDLDRFELDEPTALPDLPPGAVINALGAAPAQAPGAEGARRVVTLTHQLAQSGKRFGLAALAFEGQALALILERT